MAIRTLPRVCTRNLGSIPDRADAVAAPEVRLRGRRLISAPDEDGVAEHDRYGAGLLTEVRALLDMEVQVRRQRVSRVPDNGDLLADPHALPRSPGRFLA